MSDTLIIAAAAVVIAAMACATALRGWLGWLELRRLELARPQAMEGEDVGLRIELAAVRERLKKLEAIASGVEL